MMDRKDFMMLIEAQDALENMDKILHELTGCGHGSGEFIALDNVYEVIRNNSQTEYRNTERGEEEFLAILLNQRTPTDVRADLLMEREVG